MNLPGAVLQNCLFLYISVTSTIPGMGLGGAWTRIALEVINCKLAAKKSLLNNYVNQSYSVYAINVLQCGKRGEVRTSIDISQETNGKL